MKKFDTRISAAIFAVLVLVALPVSAASASPSNGPASPPAFGSSNLPPGTNSAPFGLLPAEGESTGVSALGVEFSPAGCRSQTDYAHKSGNEASVHGRGICNVPVQLIKVNTTLWHHAWFGWNPLDQRLAQGGKYTPDATPHSLCASTSANDFYGSTVGVSYEASGQYGGGDSSPVKTFNC